MADLPNRAALELELAKKLAAQAAAAKRRLLMSLGSAAEIAPVPASFWVAYIAGMRAILVDFLQQTFIEQGRAAAADLKIKVTWDVIDQRAADWAREYVGELIKGIEEVTREKVAEAIATAIEASQPLGDVAAAIEKIDAAFDPTRAAMIATTELTRAASEGERGIAEAGRKVGLHMTAKWQTAEDEIVCEICGMLHDRTADQNDVFTDDEGNEYGMPPAHPNCRCSVAYSITPKEPV